MRKTSTPKLRAVLTLSWSGNTVVNCDGRGSHVLLLPLKLVPRRFDGSAIQRDLHFGDPLSIKIEGVAIYHLQALGYRPFQEHKQAGKVFIPPGPCHALSARNKPWIFGLNPILI